MHDPCDPGDHSSHNIGQMERKTRELQRMLLRTRPFEQLAVVARGICNEFQEVLSKIAGSTEAALLDLPPDDPLRDLVREIQQASTRGARLAAELIALAGRAGIPEEPVALDQVIRRACHIVDGLGEVATLRLDLSPDVPAIRGEEGQLVHLVVDLVQNAVEALRGQGQVSVATRLHHLESRDLTQASVGQELLGGRYACVEVTDNGCGMAPSVSQRIFDPFFTTKPAGRGLGLAAVAGIARAHSAAIFVRSSEGSGSSITVAFPVHGALAGAGGLGGA